MNPRPVDGPEAPEKPMDAQQAIDHLASIKPGDTVEARNRNDAGQPALLTVSEDDGRLLAGPFVIRDRRGWPSGIFHSVILTVVTAPDSGAR